MGTGKGVGTGRVRREGKMGVQKSGKLWVRTGGGGGGGKVAGTDGGESCWYREKESGGYRQTESCWYGGRESRLRESCWYGGRKSGGYSEGELQVQREGKVGVRSGGKLWVW